MITVILYLYMWVFEATTSKKLIFVRDLGSETLAMNVTNGHPASCILHPQYSQLNQPRTQTEGKS